MDNNNEIKKILDDVKKVSLSTSEKSSLRDSILSYMDQYPLSISILKKSRIHSPFARFFMTAVPVFAVAVLFLGSGVSFASIASLPGDLLYPMKVGVTERVQGLFITTNKEKAHYELKLATRRLIEVEQLTAEGKLDTKSKEVAQKNFDKHTEELSLHIDALKKEDNLDEAAKVNASFTDSLITHEKIITELKNEGNKDLVDPLISSVQAEVKIATEEGLDIENKIKINEEIELEEIKEEESLDSDSTNEDESVENGLNSDLGLEVKLDDSAESSNSTSSSNTNKEEKEKETKEGNNSQSTSSILQKLLQ